MSPSQKPRKLAPTFKLPPTSDQTAKLDALEARAEQRSQGVAGRPVREASGVARPNSKLRRETRGTRIAGYVPDELERQLRVFCARERRSVSDVLTEAIERVIAKGEAARSA